MEKSTTVHSTFVLERSFAAAPEKVFAAFANPSAKRRWNFESDTHELQMHELDFRVGGGERAQMVFAAGSGTPVAGMTLRLESVFQDIVPPRRIVWAYRMDLGGHTMSASLATVEILPEGTGSGVVFTHQGAYFEDSDGPEMRKGGWTSLLGKLAKELGE